MQHSRKILFLVPAFFALALGCKKERSQAELSQQEELQIALAAVRGDAQVSFVREDVFDNVVGVNNEVGIGGTGIFGRRQPDSLSCVTILIEHPAGTAFPARVTIDFGPGCPARDGRVRSGRIVSTYSARIMEPGAVATTVFENYKVDSLSISGSQEIRNTTVPGPAPGQNRQFTIRVTDGRILKPSGNYVQWNDRNPSIRQPHQYLDFRNRPPAPQKLPLPLDQPGHRAHPPRQRSRERPVGRSSGLWHRGL
ncbi:MAG: hypothetical protein EOP50_22920 [Sphingobacteriales bacterium]|nr:MAG: hypothetical protein EOP50_22920 [Sphingobacteriales bacterium]